MDWFTSTADKHGIDLKLKPVASISAYQGKLVSWYERYGFIGETAHDPREYGCNMIRYAAEL